MPSQPHVGLNVNMSMLVDAEPWIIPELILEEVFRLISKTAMSMTLALLPSEA